MNWILTLAIATGSMCCISIILVLLLVALGIYSILQKQAINGFKKWYLKTKDTWGKRMFDNSDLRTFLKWFSVYNPSLRNSSDDKAANRINEILREEQMKAPMNTSSQVEMPPMMPPEEVKQGNPMMPPGENVIELGDEMYDPGQW